MQKVPVCAILIFLFDISIKKIFGLYKYVLDQQMICTFV